MNRLGWEEEGGLTAGTLKRVLSLQRSKKERAVLLQQQLMSAYPHRDAVSQETGGEEETEGGKEAGSNSANEEQHNSISESRITTLTPPILSSHHSHDLPRHSRPRPLTPTISTLSLESLQYDFRSSFPSRLVYVSPVVRRDMPLSPRAVGVEVSRAGAGRKSWESAGSDRITPLDDESDGEGNEEKTNHQQTLRPIRNQNRNSLSSSFLDHPFDSSPIHSESHTPSTGTSKRSSGIVSSTYSEASKRMSDEISLAEVLRCGSRFSDCTTSVDESSEGDEEGTGMGRMESED